MRRNFLAKLWNKPSLGNQIEEIAKNNPIVPKIPIPEEVFEDICRHDEYEKNKVILDIIDAAIKEKENEVEDNIIETEEQKKITATDIHLQIKKLYSEGKIEEAKIFLDDALKSGYKGKRLDEWKKKLNIK